MQLVKVKLTASCAGVDPVTGKDFSFGKGAEAEITPELCRALGSLVIHLDPKTKKTVDLKTEIPVANNLKKPAKKRKYTKKKKK
jgi:hypothetical protein